MDPGLSGGMFNLFIGLSMLFNLAGGVSRLRPTLFTWSSGDSPSGGGEMLSVLSLLRHLDMWLVKSAL